MRLFVTTNMRKERVILCFGSWPIAGTLSPRSLSTVLPVIRCKQPYLPAPSVARSLSAALPPRSLSSTSSRRPRRPCFPLRSARRPQNDSTPPQIGWDSSTKPARSRRSSKCGISSKHALDRACFRLSINSPSVCRTVEQKRGVRNGTQKHNRFVRSILLPSQIHLRRRIASFVLSQHLHRLRIPHLLLILPFIHYKNASILASRQNLRVISRDAAPSRHSLAPIKRGDRAGMARDRRHAFLPCQHAGFQRDAQIDDVDRAVGAAGIAAIFCVIHNELFC